MTMVKSCSYARLLMNRYEAVRLGASTPSFVFLNCLISPFDAFLLVTSRNLTPSAAA